MLLLGEDVRAIEQTLHRSFAVEGTRVEEHLSGLEGKEEGTGQAHLGDPRRELTHHDHHGILQLPVDLGGQLRGEELLFREEREGGSLVIEHAVRPRVQIVPVEVQTVENAKEKDRVQGEIVDRQDGRDRLIQRHGQERLTGRDLPVQPQLIDHGRQRSALRALHALLRGIRTTNSTRRARSTDRGVNRRDCRRGVTALPIVNGVDTGPKGRRTKDRLVRVGFRFDIPEERTNERMNI